MLIQFRMGWGNALVSQKIRWMEQQGETEITLDDVTWSNLADRMWKKCYIPFISEFNTEFFCFPSKETIKLLCHCMYLTQIKTNKNLLPPDHPDTKCTNTCTVLTCCAEDTSWWPLNLHSAQWFPDVYHKDNPELFIFNMVRMKKNSKLMLKAALQGTTSLTPPRGCEGFILLLTSQEMCKRWESLSTVSCTLL